MLTLKNLIKKIENKIDFPDGKNILYTSSGYTNKYIKLFDVNMKTVFKTATIIFKITSTQQYDFDDIYSLQINRQDSTNFKVKFKRINQLNPEGVDISDNIIIVESNCIFSVCFKLPGGSRTPNVQIISAQRLNSDIIFGNGEILDSLPSGTQYKIEKWKDLPLATGITVDKIAKKAIYKKENGIVTIVGGVSGITKAGTTIAQLPEGYRPATQIYFEGFCSGVRYCRWIITPAGGIMLEWVSDNTYTSAWYNLNCTFIAN